MNKFIALFSAVVLTVLCAAPVLAAGLTISPPTVEFEVPANGSAEVEFLIYDFTGNLEISLEDIPLRVEPATVPVTAKVEGTKVVLTFYGNESLGSKIYEGKIRFLAMTGGTVAMGIKVRATVTNLVEGKTPVLVEEEEEAVELEEVESSLPEETLLTTVEEGSPEPPLAPPTVPVDTEVFGLRLVGIIAGVIVTIILVVVFARRKSWV